LVSTSPDEDLIRYGLPSDLWFHVDKLSSAHVYLRLPEACQWGSWEAGLPESVQQEMGQLVKANSIEGACPYGASGRSEVSEEARERS
jgi:hypothetical protein